MATANFQLQPAINSFIERLKSKGGFTSDDLDELHTHLVDSIQDMQSKGFTPEESFLVSSCRIGDENELSEEYQKVNGAISGRPTLFLIITGMLLFFQLFLLWTLLMSLSQVIALQLGSSSEGFFFINLFFSIVIISIYFVLLNSGKSIAQLENKFHKNRVKFSIVLFCLSLLLSIFFIYISSWAIDFPVFNKTK